RRPNATRPTPATNPNRAPSTSLDAHGKTIFRSETVPSPTQGLTPRSSRNRHRPSGRPCRDASRHPHYSATTPSRTDQSRTIARRAQVDRRRNLLRDRVVVPRVELLRGLDRLDPVRPPPANNRGSAAAGWPRSG